MPIDDDYALSLKYSGGDTVIIICIIYNFYLYNLLDKLIVAKKPKMSHCRVSTFSPLDRYYGFSFDLVQCNLIIV